MLSEEEVYNGAKNWLIKNGYKVIAGQPARGVDHLPVVEIKMPTGDKGSKQAFKPDLVAIKDERIFIIECKPRFNLGDYNKILSVLNDNQRGASFIFELTQYSLLKGNNSKENGKYQCSDLRGMLAYSGSYVDGYKEMPHLVVDDWRGIANLYN